MAEYDYHRLANGIRVIHSQSSTPVAHMGVVINTGSRDELENEHGIAHMIEHVIFKGTRKRKAYNVISCLENVGGEIDAYTTKEETCVYGTFLKDYYGRAMELFADIIFNSTFPDHECEKEKEVIVDEINSYKDSPGDLIFDDFEDLIFSGHTIGRNILGTPESIARYNHTDILRFIGRTYNTDQIAICSVGPVDFKTIVRLAERHFGPIATKKRDFKRIPVNPYTPHLLEVELETHQSHCIFGNRAYPTDHQNRLAFELINNTLGGPGMNCRLNLALREKHGYTYNIESFYTPYSDTGAFGIYFGTDYEKIDRCLNIIRRELRRLREERMGTLQLDRAKKQMIGQLAISTENYSGLMLNLGRSCLIFDTIDPLSEVCDKINKLTSTDLLEVANETLDDKMFSTLIFK